MVPLFSKEGTGEINMMPDNPPPSPFRKGGSKKNPAFSGVVFLSSLDYWCL